MHVICVGRMISTVPFFHFRALLIGGLRRFMRREYYFDSIEAFLEKSPQQVLGELFENSLDGGSIESTQRDAWMKQIRILHANLTPYGGRGAVFFEFSIPRLGKRVERRLSRSAAAAVRLDDDDEQRHGCPQLAHTTKSTW